MRSYEKSLHLLERAKKSLAGGVSSHFRALEQPHPLFYVRATGARIWDVDGNESLDFTLSQGPMILGHSNAEVLESAQSATSSGQLFAGQHLAEVELSEAIQQIIPSAELIRFCVSGSEAAQAALRLARAYSGRSKYIKFEGHYHGWLDSVGFSVSPAESGSVSGSTLTPVPWTEGISPGVEDEVIVLPWNDLEKVREVLQQRGNEIAAIITEPIMCNSGCIPPEPGFLEGLREACDRHGVVLIFDEIISGFRVALGRRTSLFQGDAGSGDFRKGYGEWFPHQRACRFAENNGASGERESAAGGNHECAEHLGGGCVGHSAGIAAKFQTDIWPILPAGRTSESLTGRSRAGARSSDPDSGCGARVPHGLHSAVQGAELSGDSELRQTTIFSVLPWHERTRSAVNVPRYLVSLSFSHRCRHRGSCECGADYAC